MAALVWGTAGCLSVPDAALGPPSDGQAQLTIADYEGEPVDPLRAPRMPRLRAVLPEPAAEDEVAWLFRGPADAELLGDLERAPLLAAHRERAIPCARALTGEGLELLPLVALAPGEHTFAVAAWAIDREAPLALDVVVSHAPDAGAAWIAAWPADGAIGVGTDLPFAWLAFDGEVHGAREGVWFEGPDGLAIDADVRAGNCTALGIAVRAASCVALWPRARLAPLAVHRIAVGLGTHDAHGAPIGPLAVSFRTGSGPDSRPPEPATRPCAIDETAFTLGCALISDRSIALRIAASEPFALGAAAGDRRWSEIAASAQTALSIAALEPGEAIEIAFELSDSTGNVLHHVERFVTHRDLAALSLSEVLANPLGPEPQQEHVELWNFGDRPEPLAGVQLSDQVAELGTALATDVVLDPGARVLLVADGFDPSDASDVPIPAGTPLIRIGKALGSAGLANRGEALFLRDAEGRRLSAVPSTPAPSAGTCIARISEDPRDGSASAFAADESARCTPGR